MKLKQARSYFPAVYSGCCEATVYKSICCDCGRPTQRPDYIMSRRQVDDETLVEIEARNRALFPVGFELLIEVP
jgi:hypothetical protein